MSEDIVVAFARLADQKGGTDADWRSFLDLLETAVSEGRWTAPELVRVALEATTDIMYDMVEGDDDDD